MDISLANLLRQEYLGGIRQRNWLKTMKKAQVYATHKYARLAPNKVRVVIDLVRGQPVSEALRILKFDKTKAADLLTKVLKSAVANASNNHNLKTENMFVDEVYANGGPMHKRIRIVAKSRTSPILKRTSHIVVGISERGGK